MEQNPNSQVFETDAGNSSRHHSDNEEVTMWVNAGGGWTMGQGLVYPSGQRQSDDRADGA